MTIDNSLLILVDQSIKDFYAEAKMGISIPTVNSFCRKLDLVYVEEGVVNKEPIHWFLDFKNHRVPYTDDEIELKLADTNFPITSKQK